MSRQGMHPYGQIYSRVSAWSHTETDRDVNKISAVAEMDLLRWASVWPQ